MYVSSKSIPPSCSNLYVPFRAIPGPSSPRNVRVEPISFNAVRVQWQPPEDPNGGIIKYTIEYQPVGQGSLHLWVDTDDGNKTTKEINALNGSTNYLFRVRASSKVPGEWSKFVEARTQGDGECPAERKNINNLCLSLHRV